ncbi:hypothetical protein [Pseudoalteromonas sp. PAR1]|uniref:hypothetical protein n=1 Tax=Pseudoalteromonas sp. PAR1 TaxID=2853443 RepID=UPI00248B547F|nr:hypothetical protein [Pseudoalteromonas sp. PAR1]
MSSETNPLDVHLNLLLTDKITKSHKNLIGQLLNINSLINSDQSIEIENKIVNAGNTELQRLLREVSKGKKLADASIDNLNFDELLKLISHYRLKPSINSQKIENTWKLNSTYSCDKQSTYYDYISDFQKFVTFVDKVFPPKREENDKCPQECVVSIILPHSQKIRSKKDNIRNGAWQHITINQGELGHSLFPLIWDVLLRSLHLPEQGRRNVLADLFDPQKINATDYKLINISESHRENSNNLNIHTEVSFNDFTSNDATHLIANYKFDMRKYKSFSLLKVKKAQNTQGKREVKYDIKAIRQTLGYLLCQTSGSIITIKLNNKCDTRSSLITPFWWNETIKALRIENNPEAKSYTKPDFSFIDFNKYAQLSSEKVTESRKRLEKFFNGKDTASERKKAFESLINSDGFNKPNLPSLLYPGIF